jgi:hypothetical protein
MARPARSPLLGYNHNVRYEGRIFHVQTEDSGPGNPHLFTHLFFEGSILASKRSQYDPGTFEDEVRSNMQGQHKAILRELKQGAFDERIARFFEMRGEKFKTDEPAFVDGEAPEAMTPEEVPVESVDAAPSEAATLEAPPEATTFEAPAEAAPFETPPEAAPFEAPPEAAPFEAPPEVATRGGSTPAPMEAPLAAESAADQVSVEVAAPTTSTEAVQEFFAAPEEVAPASAAEQSPAVAAVLDLDALPTPPMERAQTPEPLPIHSTQPSVPGPGTYALRRPVREEVTEPAPKPRPASLVPPGQTRPITPIVVQRQVIVGAGGGPVTAPRKPSTTPVRRRPVSGGPYVVKEGSHADIVGATANRKDVPPPQPMEGRPEAPRTAEAKRPPAQEAAPHVSVTDQSLDDVILAYLSQGERKS